jgi:Phage terminase, small subunit
MTRRKHKRTKPIGGGGARHPNSLANLRPGGVTGSGVSAPMGNTYSLKHGAASTLAMTPTDRDLAEIIDAISATAPVRDQDGRLPPADEAAVEIAARALKRYRSVVTCHDLHGRIDDKGNERPSARFELDAERQLMRALDNLGMSPAARARLGVDVARSASLLDQADAMRAAGDRLRARAAAIEAEALEVGDTADPQADTDNEQDGNDG